VPLFKDGLAQLEKYERSGNATSRVSSALSSLQSNANPEELKVSCVPMYEACLKAARQKK
jgi:hypothetical protein